MTENAKSSLIKAWPIYLLVVISLALIAWAVNNRRSDAQRSISRPLGGLARTNPESGEQQVLSSQDAEPYSPDSHTSQVQTNQQKQPTLMDIIKARRTWDPVWNDWYGREAPNFSFSDIDGQKHELKDYRGKDVLLVFWATWCYYCKVEIPDLIELRDKTGTDELAVLAISDENEALVKPFAQQTKMNYTVISAPYRLPEPFSNIRGLPSSCFIDKQGKIKLATAGVLSLPEFQAILRAEE